MTDSPAQPEPAQDRSTLRKTLTILGLTSALLALLVRLGVTLDPEPGGASLGWRVLAAAAWLLVALGYPLLATYVKRLPAPRSDARTPRQFAGAVAWWAVWLFSIQVASGDDVAFLAVASVPETLLIVGITALFTRRRAALAAGRLTP